MMESEEKNGDLYIERVFDAEQRWIWTADKQAPGAAWVVYFFYGYCSHGVVGLRWLRPFGALRTIMDYLVICLF
ncbi:hypothetical protein HUU05_01985 [candidate division KSB1 bacterium]|nr:hypothetical protein [candidate division KSB1 bacterium]